MSSLISETAVGAVAAIESLALPATDSPAHPGTGEIELAAVLQALSDPVRLRIVVALSAGEELSC